MPEAQFIPPGTPTRIGDHNLPGGMIYVGSRLRSAIGEHVDPCLIDPTLPIAKGNADVGGNLMGYWPTYADLKPTSRLAYLNWLSTGRRSQSHDVGYPFLFLYGLERAILVDNLTEHRAAFEREIEALIDAYGGNNSFHTYASQLLDLCRLLSGVSTEEAFSNPTVLEILLAQTVEQGGAPTAESLFRLAVSMERGGPRVIQMCWPEMLAAHRRELDTLPERIPPEAFKGRLALFIKGASKSHQAIRLPGYPSQIRNLDDAHPLMIEARRIAKLAVKAMKPYIEAITLSPSSRGSEDALALIVSGPKPLNAEKVQKKIWPWSKDPIPATLQELKGDLPVLFPKRIDRQAMMSAEERLRPHNLSFVPSAFLGEIKNVSDETVVRVVAAPANDLGPAWPHVARLVSIAARLTNGRGEEDGIAAKISALFPKLPSHARIRLPAYCWWRLQSPPEKAALTRELKAVPADLKRPTALFAASICVLAKLQDNDETRKELLKLYSLMGQEEASLWNDLHTLQMSKGISQAGTIDFDRVAEIKAETAEAAALLEDIFAEKPSPVIPTTAMPEITHVELDDEPFEASGDVAASSVRPGLKPLLSQLLDLLVGKSQISLAEFEMMVRGLGLMPGGAIEAINEWAYEINDEPLFEEDGDNIQVMWPAIESL